MRTILIPTLTLALAAATAAGASAQQLAYAPAGASCAATQQSAPTTQTPQRAQKSPTAAGSYPVLVTVPAPSYGGACRPDANAVRAAAPAATARPAATAPAPVEQPVLPIPSAG